jgi:hypothetical protein
VRLLLCRACFDLLYEERCQRSGLLPTIGFRRWHPTFCR